MSIFHCQLSIKCQFVSVLTKTNNLIMKKQNRIAFLNMLSTLLLRGLSVFTSAVFSRLLGTNGYGILSTYSVWVGVMAIVGPLQTGGTLVNARVEYPPERQKAYQSSVMTLSLVSFLCCCALVILFMGPISTLLEMGWYLIALMLWHAFGSFCVSFLNTKFTYEFKAGRNLLLSLGMTLSTLALSVALIFLMPKEQRYVGRILGMAITYGTMGIGVCAYILYSGKTFFDRTYWKFCLALAIPVVFYGLSDLLLGHSDLVMVKKLLGDSQAGVYGLAYNFGTVLFSIFTALNNSWTPFFFDDMKQGNLDRVRLQAKNFLELFTVLAMGFVLLTPEVYHGFAGRDFWEGTSLVTLFAAGFYLNFLCTFPVNFEYFHKKTKMVAAATVSSCVLNIGLNYVFILRFGIAGAAAATVLSHSFQFLFHYCYTRYVLGKESYPFGIRFWWKYAAAFAFAAVLVTVLPAVWLPRWTLGAALGLWELWQIKKRKSIF